MLKTLFTAPGRSVLAVAGLLFGGLLLSPAASAQQRVTLRLTFNAEQNRYEVMATPNFTAKNFAWGPSQVSIVLPASVADEPLAVRSTEGGIWVDNSIVYEPGVMPSMDFHGVTTSGGKLDMTAGVEVLLFDFILKSGFVPTVRLFNPAIDPSSASKGMLGGDFGAYMSDAKGHDYLALNHQSVSLTTVASGETLVSGEVEVVAYPNPSSGGKFRLYLQGFDEQEMLSVRITNLKGVSLTGLEEKSGTLSGRVIDLGSAVNGFVMVRVQGQTHTGVVTRTVWLQ